MLALPFTTGITGTAGTLSVFAITCMYMIVTLFCMLEANLYSQEEETNLITMTGERFGRIGQGIAWFSFLMVMYTASAAYIVAGSPLVNHVLQATIGFHLPNFWMSVCFAFAFGIITWLPIRIIDWCNRVLMIGLIISYGLILHGTLQPLDPQQFVGGHSEYLWAAIPMTMLAFTAHLILPSLRQYYDHELPILKRVLIIGNLVPLVIYVLWQFLLVNIIGLSGPHGLIALAQSDHPVSSMIAALTQHGVNNIANLNQVFSLFALVTSFVGISLSLRDFLIDALNLTHRYHHRLLVMLLAILPPLTFAEYNPSGFLQALSYTGIFVAILYTIMPPLMVWQARYVAKLPNPGYRIFGGKAVLAVVIAIGFSIVVVDIAGIAGLIPTP